MNSRLPSPCFLSCVQKEILFVTPLCLGGTRAEVFRPAEKKTCCDRGLPVSPHAEQQGRSQLPAFPFLAALMGLHPLEEAFEKPFGEEFNLMTTAK